MAETTMKTRMVRVAVASALVVAGVLGGTGTAFARTTWEVKGAVHVGPNSYNQARGEIGGLRTKCQNQDGEPIGDRIDQQFSGLQNQAIVTCGAKRG